MLANGPKRRRRCRPGPVRVILSRRTSPHSRTARCWSPDDRSRLGAGAQAGGGGGHRRGGRTCHAAIVSRELGHPCVVGTVNGDPARSRRAGRSRCRAPRATTAASTGRVRVRADRDRPGDSPHPAGAAHAERRRTRTGPSLGAAPERRRRAWPASSSSSPTGSASTRWRSLHPERVDRPRGARPRSGGATATAPSGPAFFVERLASGVAQIAAAFYPRPSSCASPTSRPTSTRACSAGAASSRPRRTR